MTKNQKTNADDIILSTLENGKNMTIKDYELLVKENDKPAIAEIIFFRLYGRYLKPFTFESKIYKEKYKSGFGIMANCCLCIEALQSFKNGWSETPKDKNGNKVFDDFFSKHNGLKKFAKQGFYKHIRCGILHQGETTDGWRIKRKGLLIENKTINAVKFLEQLRQALYIYVKELQNSKWDSKIWNNCRVKMRNIIENCKLK